MANSTLQDVPRPEWVVLVKDAHVGYISWEDYERNEAQLAMNSQAYAPERFSPPREGPALLQGLLLCGKLWRADDGALSPASRTAASSPTIFVRAKALPRGARPCQRIPGT